MLRPDTATVVGVSYDYPLIFVEYALLVLLRIASNGRKDREEKREKGQMKNE